MEGVEEGMSRVEGEGEGEGEEEEEVVGECEGEGVFRRMR
jgi:hypothetical protein